MLGVLLLRGVLLRHSNRDRAASSHAELPSLCPSSLPHRSWLLQSCCWSACSCKLAHMANSFPSHHGMRVGWKSQACSLPLLVQGKQKVGGGGSVIRDPWHPSGLTAVVLKGEKWAKGWRLRGPLEPKARLPAEGMPWQRPCWEGSYCPGGPGGQRRGASPPSHNGFFSHTSKKMVFHHDSLVVSET